MKNKTDKPNDHWALLATEKMLSIKNNDEYLPVSSELLTDHAVQICETVLQEQLETPGLINYDGGFSIYGSTTHTATRLEGLLAALSFLPRNHEIRKRVHSAIDRGIPFLLRAQVSEGVFAGAIPRTVCRISGDVPYLEKFNRRVTEVRIDYVQHALSAMVQYLHLMNDNK